MRGAAAVRTDAPCPHQHCVPPCPNEGSASEQRARLFDAIVARYGNATMKKGWAAGLVKRSAVLDLLGLALLPGATVDRRGLLVRPRTWSVSPLDVDRGGKRAVTGDDYAELEAPRAELAAAMSRMRDFDLSARWKFQYDPHLYAGASHSRMRFIARVSVNDLAFFHVEWNR